MEWLMDNSMGIILSQSHYALRCKTAHSASSVFNKPQVNKLASAYQKYAKLAGGKVNANRSHQAKIVVKLGMGILKKLCASIANLALSAENTMRYVRVCIEA